MLQANDWYNTLTKDLPLHHAASLCIANAYENLHPQDEPLFEEAWSDQAAEDKLPAADQGALRPELSSGLVPLPLQATQQEGKRPTEEKADLALQLQLTACLAPRQSQQQVT